MSDSTKQIASSQDAHVTGNALNRSMSVWHSFTLGFAVVSPVAGLYAIIGVQTVVAGGGWFAALAVCLLMQLLVATVYAELSSQFPIAGGAYKWARQLGGAIAGHDIIQLVTVSYRIVMTGEGQIFENRIGLYLIG